MNKPGTLLRTMPYNISHPQHICETILVSLPMDRRLTPESKVVKDPAFRFSSERTVTSKTVSIRLDFETLADQVDAERTGEYLTNIKQAIDDLGYAIWISKDMAQTTFTPVAEGGVKTSEIASNPAVSGRNTSLFLFLVFLAGLGGGLYWFLRRRGQISAGSPLSSPESLHRCNFCGKTELTAPELDFRVSGDGEEYCHPHLPKPR